MGPGEPDDELDDGPHRGPLPLDDRLWRHPSEIEYGRFTPRATKVVRLLSSLFSRPRP